MGSQRVRHEWAHTHPPPLSAQTVFCYPFIHRGTLGCFHVHVSFSELVFSQCNVWLHHITSYKALSLLGYMWRLWLSLSLNCGKAGVPAVLLEPPTYSSSTFFLTFIIIFFICSGFCHTLKWNSHGFTCVPHPDPPSHLPLHPLPLGLLSAPGPSTCLMHPTWSLPLIKGHSKWNF